MAKRDNIYKDYLYKAGTELDFDGLPMICPKCSGKKDVIICGLCKDSGRIDPPHHFKELRNENGEAESIQGKDKGFSNKEKEGKKVLVGEDKYRLAREATKLEMDQLKSEIKRLGGSYNGTWGLERLKMHAIKVYKENGEKNVVPEPNVVPELKV